ncbi:MAG: hypothetical protein IT233_05560 [Bacteroidia bacterium]|nr:hypothetical protein [Bacteroidia bacterium]
MIIRFFFIPLMGLMVGLFPPVTPHPQEQDHKGHQHDDGHKHPKQPERLEWTATRKLTWKDYKGNWNNTRAVEVMSLISTFYNHFQSKSGDTIIVETMPIFYPEDSYVKPERKTKEQLFHEQTKFDLYEVWARKLRKEFSTYAFSKATYSTFMQSMYKANLMARNSELAKYNTETNSGKDAVKQKTWADKISKQLGELAAWKSHSVIVKPK